VIVHVLDLFVADGIFRLLNYVRGLQSTERKALNKAYACRPPLLVIDPPVPPAARHGMNYAFPLQNGMLAGLMLM
jgi:hypothetical protein